MLPRSRLPWTDSDTSPVADAAYPAVYSASSALLPAPGAFTSSNRRAGPGSFLGKVDLESGATTVVEPPTPQAGTRRVWSDSKGRLWISEWNAEHIAMYDPKSASWKTCRLPGDEPHAYAIYVDNKDKVWVSDFKASRVSVFLCGGGPGSPRSPRPRMKAVGKLWVCTGGNNQNGHDPQRNSRGDYRRHDHPASPRLVSVACRSSPRPISRGRARTLTESKLLDIRWPFICLLPGTLLHRSLSCVQTSFWREFC